MSWSVVLETSWCGVACAVIQILPMCSVLGESVKKVFRRLQVKGNDDTLCEPKTKSIKMTTLFY